jgi:hypothetical protein
VADIPDPASESEPAVDLTKSASASANGAGGAGSPPAGSDPPAPPRSMQLALGAIVVQLVLAAVYAILSWPLASQLHDAVIKSNAKQKKPKVLCGVTHPGGCLDVDKTVHAIQRSTLIITVVIGLLIIFLMPRLRKGVRSSRTFYVAVTIISAMLGFSASPLSLVALFSGGPVVPRVIAVLGALASALAIVALFVRESQRYFAVRSPNPLGPRPGLGSLFRPRPPAPRTSERVAGMRSNPNRGENRPAARAKSRNDAEAIARGAALARSRAKANKSRRTDV